jgi:hypothetical protein
VARGKPLSRLRERRLRGNAQRQTEPSPLDAKRKGGPHAGPRGEVAEPNAAARCGAALIGGIAALEGGYLGLGVIEPSGAHERRDGVEPALRCGQRLGNGCFIGR